MMSLATILIPARNASSTIERALLSALAQGDYPLILVDDFSTDNTVDLARGTVGDRLRVVRPIVHKTVGLARQTGIQSVETPYTIWLDADDELLPGRVDRMLETLQHERADIACDGVELFDGSTETLLDILRIPSFLMGYHPLARLFERNYLPGTAVIGVSTQHALRIGYDPELHGPEDIDFILRSVASGARFCLLDSIGYRLYAYSNSLSRNLENQRHMYRTCLLKHDYSEIRTLYQQAGHSDRIATWGLVSMAVFRQEYDKALELLTQAELQIEDPDEVLEPNGPCPAPEQWRLSFQRGTLLLLLGRVSEALDWLETAEQTSPSAEGANNLGVAKGKLGDFATANELFNSSLARFPGYLDATSNLDSPNPNRITSHPLRAHPSRKDYSERSSES